MSKQAETELYRRHPLELVESGQLWIRTKSGEIKQFIPNYAQKIVLDLIKKRIEENKPVRIRLLKSRQLGFSTLFESIIYAFTSRREGFHSLVIADDEEGSKELFEMNKLYHERLPDHIKPELKKSNEIALEFEGLKSKINIDTSRNKRAGRGSTYQIVHKSESSRFQFYKEVNLGIANAVADLPGTMIFDETTANGINFYYEEVQRSMAGLDGYDFIFIPWFYNPEYSLSCYGNKLDKTEKEKTLCLLVFEGYKIILSDDQINWRRFAMAHKCGGDEKLFMQEYPSFAVEAFIFSGRPRFDMDILRTLKSNCVEPLSTDGLLEIYQAFDYSAKYVLGVDTSEGLESGDNSSVTILNTKDFIVAAHYSGKVEPDILAGMIKDWALRYNQALVVVESNNHGLVTLKYLKEIYQNLYSRKIYEKLSDVWTEKIGFQTNTKTKPLLISNLDRSLRDGLRIHSNRIVNELMSYVIEDDGSTNASEGNKDDSVISTALAVQGYLETREHSIPEPKPTTEDGTVAKILETRKQQQTMGHRYQGLRFAR